MGVGQRDTQRDEKTSRGNKSKAITARMFINQIILMIKAIQGQICYVKNIVSATYKTEIHTEQHRLHEYKQFDGENFRY